MSWKMFVAAIMAASLAACATSMTSAYDKPAGKNLVVTKDDWAGYQEYLGKIGSTGQGAFAIRIEGDRSFGYYYVDCPYSACMFGKTYPNDAMDRCKGAGGTCILFASGHDIRVNYSVEQ